MLGGDVADDLDHVLDAAVRAADGRGAPLVPAGLLAGLEFLDERPHLLAEQHLVHRTAATLPIALAECAVGRTEHLGLLLAHRLQEDTVGEHHPALAVEHEQLVLETVDDVGQELFVPLDAAEQQVDLLVVAGVADGGAADLGQGDGEADLHVGEHPRPIGEDAHRADHLVVHLERHGQQRDDALGPHILLVLDPRVAADIVDGHRLTGKHHADVPFLLHIAALEVALGKTVSAAQLQVAAFLVEQAQGAALGAHGHGHPLGHGLQDHVQVQGRVDQPADRLQFAQETHLPVHLLEHPPVGDGDAHLLGQGHGRGDLVRGEGPPGGTGEQAHDADQLVLEEDRQGEHALDALAAGGVTQGGAGHLVHLATVHRVP